MMKKNIALCLILLILVPMTLRASASGFEDLPPDSSPMDEAANNAGDANDADDANNAGNAPGGGLDMPSSEQGGGYSEPDDAKARVITISAVGDTTLGGNMKGNPKTTIYTREFDRQSGDYGFAFRNTWHIFEADDVTIANFEGTLTDSTKAGNNNKYQFRAPPSHVEVLKRGSVEMVTLENNHILDFGQKGLEDTKAALDAAGVEWAYGDHFAQYSVDGFVVGLLAYQTFGGTHDRIIARLPDDIQRARTACDFIVVYYHWGSEEDYYPNSNQLRLGRATVDAGADLVLGAHSHRINPIELYNGKYIVYSLSNFSFSGNARPKDMRSFIFQCKVDTKTAKVTDMRIIPIRISSQPDVNDFAPIPLPPGSAAYKSTLEDMVKNGKNLKYGLSVYKTEWTQ